MFIIIFVNTVKKLLNEKIIHWNDASRSDKNLFLDSEGYDNKLRMCRKFRYNERIPSH